MNLGRREFNSTLHQSSHGFAIRDHGLATKTKALTREIPPAMQAKLFVENTFGAVRTTCKMSNIS